MIIDQILLTTEINCLVFNFLSLNCIAHARMYFLLLRVESCIVNAHPAERYCVQTMDGKKDKKKHAQIPVMAAWLIDIFSIDLLSIHLG